MEGSECTICGNPIRSTRGVSFKTASCCGEMTQMHTNCAMKYYSVRYPEPNELFDEGAWYNNKSIKMFCLKCCVNCLFCKRKHTLSV